MSYLAPTQEESSPPSGLDSPEEEPSTHQLTFEELSAMVMKMNRDKKRDHQIIKDLKAQISQPNIEQDKESKYRDKRRQTSEVLSMYLATKRLSGKINSPKKLTDGITPKAKYWLISMVNKLTINDDHFKTKLAKMAFIWGRIDGLTQSILKFYYTSTDSD